MDKVRKLVSQRAVVVFSISSCCICHTVKSLLHDLGVNAAVHELDEEPRGREMEKALAVLVRRNPVVPLVFIGGKLVGSTDRIMSLHLGGKLVPLLHEAGALWPELYSTFTERSRRRKRGVVVERTQCRFAASETTG
ncbi:hypothetical protein B296_00058446 [Ensete ventricosum]|uniref:Glutaredoxin domain-containing protein n=1 Tax=Ensete ventricosum TaxID=4639 RepID=A0A426X6Z0_ENSVE|nr:hypothetical protein B296_00058446 [Ensete ventricosum]